MKTTIRQLEDIADWMLREKRMNQSSELPAILKGVFFMNGNPLPDDCLTLEGGQWNPSSRCLMLPVYSPYQWTFSPTQAGHILLNLVQITKTTYEINFDQEFKKAQVTPIILGLRVPKWIADFSMIQTEDSTQGDKWYRQNSWLMGLSHVGEYVLTKIIDRDGQSTKLFTELKSTIPNEFLVVQEL